MSFCSPSEGNRPSAEVADIFRDHLHELGSIGPEQWKVVNALISCRTARLGGHVYACDHCGQTLTAYNSCRNRHCPKCQAAARAKWLDERMDELLPVEYFHVVFTIPDVLNHLVLVNKAVLYEKTMSVSTAEFMRRFLLHVLPTHFMRIRSYGLLSNRNKNENLAVCRSLLYGSSETEQSDSQGLPSAQPTATTETAILCPNCHHGHLVSVMIIEPELAYPEKTKRLDSS